MDIYEYLAQMKPLVASRSWDTLEERFHHLAVELAGAEQATRIAEVDFSDYRAALASGLQQAVSAAKKLGARAIYFEYDLDNDWDSGFFLCQGYQPEHRGDDDWACDWLEDLSGPDFPELSEIYCENDFDRTDVAKGSTLFLVARTVATFGRCFDEVPGPDLTGLAVCMAFHDQEPVLRIRESAGER